MVGEKEFINLQRRVMSLEEENTRLRMEVRQLKESLQFMDNYITKRFHEIKSPKKIGLDR